MRARSGWPNIGNRTSSAPGGFGRSSGSRFEKSRQPAGSYPAKEPTGGGAMFVAPSPPLARRPFAAPGGDSQLSRIMQDRRPVHSVRSGSNKNRVKFDVAV